MLRFGLQAPKRAEVADDDEEESSETAPSQPSGFNLKSLFGGRGAQQAVVSC